MKAAARNNEFWPQMAQLTKVIDEDTTPSQANDQIVYHADVSVIDAGIYANLGTTAHPSWIMLDDYSGDETQGAPVNNVEYLGRNMDTDGFPKPTLKVTDLNLEFRFAQDGKAHGLQVRLISAPSQMVNFKAAGDMRGTTRLKFAVANYNVWQYMGPTNEWWAYFCYITTDESPNLDKICVFYAVSSYGNHGANAARENYFLAAES